MTVTYFKRYRMERKLDGEDFNGTDADGRLDNPNLPVGFRLVPWAPRLLNEHAEVKWQSFRNEIDAHVFPCLAELEGCRHLMKEITGRKDFVPQATWLACRETEFSQGLQPCGTVQGLFGGPRQGAIQNLGVHPDCRDQGLGAILLTAALRGFQLAGCRSVHLEVTVENTAAIRLYERYGFRKTETLFKFSDVQFA